MAVSAQWPCGIETETVDCQVLDEEIYIPLSSGLRLAARLWRPPSSETQPVPAVLEYIPYRKRDGTRDRDERLHPYFAAHGYAAVRVDLRGSGDSEGLLLDEYLPSEQQDGAEVVEWLARQSWCSGAVGMLGLSWGGITALQVACLAPPSLKTIIPVGASVDRYYDDACYFVGCFSGETVGWGAVMFGFNSRPPDPAVLGEDWRPAWLKRLEAAPLFLQTWLEHQRRDDYWLQGTICTDYSRVRIPVYAICGWNDCWPNTVLRLLANLDVPRKGLIGPWGHMYPDEAHPGPGANFADEAIRWFDRWLKDLDNGIDEEPALTCYLQDRAAIDPRDNFRPGRWVDVACWPPQDLADTTYFLSNAGLMSSRAMTAEIAAVSSPLSVGIASGEYMPLAQEVNDAGLPGDQGEDDARSTLFDSAPLADALEILGTPWVTLDLESSADCGMVAVRLCDVGEDGTSVLITYGLLNLAQREGRETPLPVQPGQRYQVRLRLNDTGYCLAKGHRLRLAVSNALWPMAWPVPRKHALTLHLQDCELLLPHAAAPPSDPQRLVFRTPRNSKPSRTEVIRAGTLARELSRDLITGRHSYRILRDHGKVHVTSSALNVASRVEAIFTLDDDDPLSACASYRFNFGYERGDWRVCTEGWLEMTCDAEFFHLDACLEAFEGNERIFERHWQVPIARDGF